MLETPKLHRAGPRMWETVLDRLLRRLVREGQLELTLPGGAVTRYGDPGAPVVQVQLLDPALRRQDRHHRR